MIDYVGEIVFEILWRAILVRAYFETLTLNKTLQTKCSLSYLRRSWGVCKACFEQISGAHSAAQSVATFEEKLQGASEEKGHMVKVATASTKAAMLLTRTRGAATTSVPLLSRQSGHPDQCRTDTSRRRVSLRRSARYAVRIPDPSQICQSPRACTCLFWGR